MPAIRLTRPTKATVCWYVGAMCLLLWVAWNTGLRMAPGWSADDGVHLRFSSVYGAAQYLTHPDVLLIGSYANLTPVLHLFYTANLALFGLDPAAFRIVVAILSVLSIASLFACAHVYLSRWLALYVAAAFATSVPFFYTAATFMTSHYLVGLLCACLCLLFFSRWVASGKLLWLAAAVLCFALAIFSKEVYVPLIGLLLLHSPLRKIWRGIVPMVLVLGIYFMCRYLVLGSLVGGYRGGQVVHGAEWLDILHNLAQLPLVLFGGLLGATVAGGIFFVVMMLAPWRHGVRLIAASACVLVPLLPLLAANPLTEPDRYFFVATAMLLFGLAWLAQAALQRSATLAPWHIAVLLVPLWGILLTQHHRIVPGLITGINLQAALYREVLAQTNSLVIVNPGLPSEDSYWSATLNHARDAQARLSGRDEPPSVLMVSDRQSPILFGLQGQGPGIYEFDAKHCQCLQPYRPEGSPSLNAHGLALARINVLYVLKPSQHPENNHSVLGDSVQTARRILPDNPRTLEITGVLNLSRELDWMYLVLPFRDQPSLENFTQPVAPSSFGETYKRPFVLNLRFATPELARQAEEKLCITVPSVLRGPYALLQGQPDYCNAFLNARLLLPATL